MLWKNTSWSVKQYRLWPNPNGCGPVCVRCVVETNGLSLLSFLPHFQPDPFLFPLSLPFRPSSSPPLSRVGFLQSSARVLPSVACALTLFHGSGRERVLGGRLASLNYWLTEWLLTWQLGEENIPQQEDWDGADNVDCMRAWFNAQRENMWVTCACAHGQQYMQTSPQ